MNIIYQTIKDIQKDFKSSDNYLNQSQVVELVNQSRGLFWEKTIWNNTWVSLVGWLYNNFKWYKLL